MAVPRLKAKQSREQKLTTTHYAPGLIPPHPPPLQRRASETLKPHAREAIASSFEQGLTRSFGSACPIFGCFCRVCSAPFPSHSRSRSPSRSPCHYRRGDEDCWTIILGFTRWTISVNGHGLRVLVIRLWYHPRHLSHLPTSCTPWVSWIQLQQMQGQPSASSVPWSAPLTLDPSGSG